MDELLDRMRALSSDLLDSDVETDDLGMAFYPKELVQELCKGFIDLDIAMTEGKVGPISWTGTKLSKSTGA